MNKLKYQNKSDDYISRKYSEYLNLLVALYDTLKHLPVKSILGRMGTEAEIRIVETKLDLVRNELIKRGLLETNKEEVA